MKLGMEVGLGPGHIVLDGDPTPPSPKEAQPPIFGPCLLWINMPLRMNVDLSPGHIVLDEDPAPPTKNGHSSPKFWPMSVVAKWLDGSRCQLVTWYGGRPRPRRHCIRWGSSSLSKGALHPHFSAHVAKPLDESRCHLVQS